jgi:hypothetical protein
MARSRAAGNPIEVNGSTMDGETPGHTRVRIDEDCLQLVPKSADEVSVLRRLVDQVNSRTCSQPFLLEGPPGCFSLYVGDAAERVRTSRGIL